MADDGQRASISNSERFADIYECLVNVHGLIVDAVRIQQLGEPEKTKAIEEFAVNARASLHAVAASFRELAAEIKRDGK